MSSRRPVTKTGAFIPAFSNSFRNGGMRHPPTLKKMMSGFFDFRFSTAFAISFGSSVAFCRASAVRARERQQLFFDESREVLFLFEALEQRLNVRLPFQADKGGAAELFLPHKFGDHGNIFVFLRPAHGKDIWIIGKQVRYRDARNPGYAALFNAWAEFLEDFFRAVRTLEADQRNRLRIGKSRADICNGPLRIAPIVEELYFDPPPRNAPGFVEAVPFSFNELLNGLDMV